MHYFSNTTIEKIALHQVGNKTVSEPVRISGQYLHLRETTGLLLMNYFLSSFKLPEYFQFDHPADVQKNEVFACVDTIFNRPDSLLEQSGKLARYLYEQSAYPRTKGGEFCVVHFKDCIVDGEPVDAVGLFKSENKDTFLKIFPAGEGFVIESEEGINIHKLDKGCLIFNTERENGYIVAVVDNSPKNAEARYWTDDFLRLRPRHDEYFHTDQTLSLCRRFVKEALPVQHDVSRIDQADLLNKSVQFFKEQENFNADEFAGRVMEQPDIIESFNRYKQNYQREFEVELPDDFNISENAVKKQARVFKSVIKLDKNFHIYVHGNRKLIEQGKDENGKFYKIYYKEES